MAKQLFDRGFSAGILFKQLKCLGLNWLFMYRTIHWLLDSISSKDRPRSGYPHSVHTKEGIKRIQEKLRKNPQHSANKMAAKESMSSKIMQVIIKDDLGFCPYLKRKFEGLTAAQIIKKLQRCKKLLNW